MTQPIRIAIDARLRSGEGGGIETVLVGIADGLSRVSLEGFEITLVGYAGHTDWIRNHLVRALRLETVEAPWRPQVALRSALGPLAQPVRRIRNAVKRVNTHIPHDRAMDALGADIVHFAHQEAGYVSMPFIYQPHDLQHLHMPEFFPQDVLTRRKTFYGPLCRAATRVVVGTSWVKDDVVDRLGVDASKVTVIPLAPVTSVPPSPIRPAALPSAYLLYPAACWPHKNHRRLLEAFRLLVDAHPDANLVLTGAQIRAGGVDVIAIARMLGLENHVHALGFLSEADLTAAYAAARGVVVPTLFESASFPIWEAFERGVPVACSSVTALPRQVGDAALMFDPHDVHAIAAAMSRLWCEPALRTALVVKGRARVVPFSWPATAERYLALYRTIAGRSSEADRALLAEEPLL
jgi:glycosyltransferase involved in cell wall biosynthesis